MGLGLSQDIQQKLFKAGRSATNPFVISPVILIFSTWLFFRDDSSSTINVYFSAAMEFGKGLFAFISIFGSYRLWYKERILGWKIICAACIFWTIGQVVYGSAIISSESIDMPQNVADYFFIIAIPLAIIGFLSVGMHGLSRAEKVRIVLDSLSFTCAFAFIALTFLVQLSSANELKLTEDIELQSFFFILDITFASLAFSMMLYRRFDKMIVPIGIGMMLQASADMMWIIDQFRGEYTTRPYARLMLFTAAALYCFSATRSSGTPTKKATELGDKQLRLGVFATIFFTIVYAIFFIPTREQVPPILAVSFAALFVVVLIGQITSHYENHKLTKQQSETLEAVTASEERFRIAFENGPTGLLLVDDDGLIVKANKAFAKMIALTPAELIGTELIMLIHPDDRETHLRMMNSLTNPNAKIDYEVRFVEREGIVSWGSVSISEMPNSVDEINVVYQIEDISERKTSEQRLQYLAIHDPLTALANRTYFIERTDEALRVAKAEHQTLGVLFIDLDRFKVINDSLGHSVGDQVIQTIAHRIRRVVGERGTVARFGGDEFTVLISPPTTERLAHMIATEILDEVIKPFPLGDGEAYLSCSIGVVLSDGESKDAQALLRDADSAMYRAKELGRNRIETADRQVHQRVMKELKTVNELHKAVSNDEMKVYYQPIMNLHTGYLAGFEALVRWQHPKRGLISPDIFIPMAEDTGLILEIGNKVMREAYEQLEIWQKQYASYFGNQVSAPSPITMSVNLAVRQLSDEKLLDNLNEIYETTDVEPDTKILEITESVLLGDTRHAITILNEIHSLGYKLRVDDFGTGYSALAYLKRFPIDGFKIDKSFINGYGANDNDTAIVHALIGLAESLHLDVVAEGVETKDIEKSLRSLGCDYGQGFLYSRALPATEIRLENYVISNIDSNTSDENEVIDLTKRFSS